MSDTVQEVVLGQDVAKERVKYVEQIRRARPEVTIRTYQELEVFVFD